MDDERAQSLINARLACEWLGVCLSTMFVRGEDRTNVACLIDEFTRLDAKEQGQVEAGKLGAPHGSKGGRPRKEKK
jgi:hypothetical protein